MRHSGTALNSNILECPDRGLGFGAKQVKCPLNMRLVCPSSPNCESNAKYAIQFGPR
jgi:hypothetical protein